MIELTCEGCGKTIRAPREAAGRQAKCPACGHAIYIPSPEDEVGELPLAPEDAEDLRREAALLEERRRLDRILAREDRAPAEGATGNARSGSRGEPVGGRGPAHAALSAAQEAEQAVLEYLVALRDSNLEQADRAIAVLRHYRGEARQVVERLAADQIPPPAMARVPVGVYQGFLKNLRAQLS